MLTVPGVAPEDAEAEVDAEDAAAAEEAARLDDEDMEASCNCGCPEVEGGSLPSEVGDPSEGPVGELCTVERKRWK